ncbi:MAG: diguanylate cyclase [Clostridia bacterium]|nr:diguanylate cyclase [Clostridia bacterium]
MRQVQFEYREDTIKRELKKIAQWSKKSMVSKIVFDIYTTLIDGEKVKSITTVIDDMLPGAIYRGCTTNGNIVHGNLSVDSTSIICTIFEYPDTKVDVRQYKFDPTTEKSVLKDLKAYVAENQWVKAIEMLVTIRGMSMTEFCDDLSELPEHIKIYGGGALSADLNNNTACVFSSKGDFSDESLVCLFLGGSDFDIITTHITGWKPLGRELHVTKADGRLLQELDGKPAYDTYYHFLKIKNDEHFFENTLEFPFLYRHNGLDILRAPTACTPEGSLLMTADMKENVSARIAYGDPRTILDSIKKSCVELKKFQPESIHIYSCAARRTFWGKEIYKETQPMQSMAQTSGFYTSGEFLRTGKYVDLHNVTLVVGAMREGTPNEHKSTEYEFEREEITGNVSMINRLASFIEAATEELEIMAITDGLTGLYNRKEIQRRISEDMVNHPDSVALIMIDADNFKKINDVHGHNVGDEVLKGLSRSISHELSASGADADAGRWGGEEFMIRVVGCKRDAVAELAEKIRISFANTEFAEAGHQTISLGIAYAKHNETVDALCVRVDDALYEAKHTGKNRVCICE